MSDTKHESEQRGHISPAVHWRIVISLFLLAHLTAIVVPPFSLQASGPLGSSPVSDVLRTVFHPYIDIAFLNHGYAFFAPNPGPSHLIRARMTFNDAREPFEQTFPNLQQQWPRLLYHRHFMLSEQLNSQYEPPELPVELREDAIIVERWKTARAAYELKWRGFEEHLRHKHDAAKVELTRVRHLMIDVFEVVEESKPLDSPDKFVDLREDGTIGEAP